MEGRERNRDIIKKVLDGIVLKQECWEADEDIITINGKPVGGTVSRNNRQEFGQWWPSLKLEIAVLLSRELPITYPCKEHNSGHECYADNCFQCGKEPCRIDFSNAKAVK